MPLEQIREFLMVGAAEVGYEDFEAAIGSLGRDEIKEFRYRMKNLGLASNSNCSAKNIITARKRVQWCNGK
jgi:hypothetical protein